MLVTLPSTLPQVQTSMETQVSQVLLGTEVTQEKPTPFQALSEHQDRKGSKEFQVRPERGIDHLQKENPKD